MYKCQDKSLSAARDYLKMRQYDTGVMVSKIVSLDQLQLSIELDPHWVTQTFGFVPYQSYAYKTSMGQYS